MLMGLLAASWLFRKRKKK
ncbi:MAG: LPXTG cell wall anchor domain-containing protein [Verrucomicrobia bacterium]|nr:LPXTG cell wall anchor domain-containing protein [Verrucomicrobiota bacterium]